MRKIYLLYVLLLFSGFVSCKPAAQSNKSLCIVKLDFRHLVQSIEKESVDYQSHMDMRRKMIEKLGDLINHQRDFILIEDKIITYSGFDCDTTNGKVKNLLKELNMSHIVDYKSQKLSYDSSGNLIVPSAFINAREDSLSNIKLYDDIFNSKLEKTD